MTTINGRLFGHTTLGGKQVRTGVISLLSTDTSKAVVFTTVMPSASYTVMFESAAGLYGAVSFGVETKTTSGFTVLSVGIAVTLMYQAVEN